MAFIIPIILALLAALVWQSPELLNELIIKLNSRKDAILVYRKSKRWHRMRLASEER